jgi:glycerophosphoryl diester phosphodiesterase
VNPLLDPDARLVVAHRGDSAHAPEDTLESLRLGVSHGPDAIEFDLRRSKDGEIVVIHDPTVDRTTDGTGPVRVKTLAELKALDAGYRFTRDGGRSFPFRGQGVRIPTFREVLAAFPDIPMIVEVKIAEASPGARALIESYRAEQRVLIGSFKDDCIAPFRGSRIAIGAASGEVARLYLRALLPGGPARVPYQALCIPPFFHGLPLPILRFARMGRQAGICTHVWTVDDPRQAQRYWAGGVNAIITNDPGAIVKVRP